MTDEQTTAQEDLEQDLGGQGAEDVLDSSEIADRNIATLSEEQVAELIASAAAPMLFPDETGREAFRRRYVQTVTPLLTLLGWQELAAAGVITTIRRLPPMIRTILCMGIIAGSIVLARNMTIQEVYAGNGDDNSDDTSHPQPAAPPPGAQRQPGGEPDEL